MSTTLVMFLSLGAPVDDPPVAEVDDAPVADVADGPPVAETPETVVPLSPGSVRYAELRSMVEAGRGFRVAVNAPGSAGIVEVKDAPPEIPPGLYDCFPEGGVPKMRPVARELAAPTPVYRSYAEQLNGN